MLKVLVILAFVIVAFFLLTFVIYFFNLDMKLTASLIRPLTAWYDWSEKRRKARADKK